MRTILVLVSLVSHSPAQATGGEYFYAAQAGDLERIYTSIGSRVSWTEERTEVTARCMRCSFARGGADIRRTDGSNPEPMLQRPLAAESMAEWNRGSSHPGARMLRAEMHRLFS